MKLTLPQTDIYFEQLLYPEDPIYNIGAKISIEGEVDINAFKQAYQALIDQHDAYRSILRRIDDEVDLVISHTHNSCLGFIDLSAIEDAKQAANVYMEKEFKKPFDLLSGNFLHAFTLIKVRDNFYYLFSVYHHIITDGWGTSLMFQRLVQFYNEIIELGKVQSDYPFLYTDFVKDDEHYCKSTAFDEDKKYWKDRFLSLPESMFIPLNATVRLNRSLRKELILDREFYNQLIQFSANRKATTFHVILATLFCYFGRVYQNDDFAIGIPVLNRLNAKFKKTVGLFMGVNPFRLRFDFDATVDELILQIKDQLKKDYRHQRFPLGHLIKELHLFNEKDKIFNITLSYEHQNYSSHFLNTKTKVVPLTHQAERVALAIYIREFDEHEDVKIDFDYNLNYFTDAAISTVATHFKVLLETIIKSASKKIKDLNYLTDQETQLLLKDYNATGCSYPTDKTVVDLFERITQQTPGKIAIKDNDSSFTYDKGMAIINNVASCLCETYGNVNEPVGVIAHRSAKLILVLLGILKSGKAYIPIDPAMPEERIRFIIDNSRLRAIITDDKEGLVTGTDQITIDALLNYKPGDNFAASNAKATDTAYIIYTSGSTGNPKGVEVSHRSLTNFLLSIQAIPGISAGDVLYAVTTYSFDISILEFFAPLISGATVFIASQETLFDPIRVIDDLIQQKPTIIQATPGFYQMLHTAGWKGDKELKVLCGGDLLSEALAGKLINTTREVWNMYGPTETTIWSGTKRITVPKEANNIGKPINNTSFYILDAQQQLLPSGINGELYIGGHGLAKGYYLNKQLTEERFVENPFSPGQRMYKTGDIGKWNFNGEIEFLGRNDSQVKIRGYRVELGEIETRLNQYLAIDNAVVVDVKQNDHENILVAFIPKANHGNFNFEDIKKFLRSCFPEYMIPSIFMEIEQLPYTHNKKVDRKLLRTLKYELPIQSTLSPELSVTEKKLAEIWRRILNYNGPVQSKDSFFNLGGHSMLMARMISIISAELNVIVSMKAAFENHTLEKLASFINTQSIGTEAVKINKAVVKEYYALTQSQYTIWLACLTSGSSVMYNMFAAYRINGIFNKEKFESIIRVLIERHEIFRTNIVELSGIPHQKITPGAASAFQISELSAITDNHAKDLMNQFANYEFNLEQELLLRMAVLKNEDGKNTLLFLTHHVILDGISLSVFINKVAALYKNAPVETDDLQFKDYSEWLNERYNINNQTYEGFWKNKLKLFSPENTIHKKNNYPNSTGRGNNGKRVNFSISDNSFNRLKEFSLINDTTLFSTFVTILTAFLSKHSDNTDVCIGIVTSGRDLPVCVNLMGMMAATFPFCVKINPQQSFESLLKSVNAELSEIYEHAGLPTAYNVYKEVDILMIYQPLDYSTNRYINIDNFVLEPIMQKEFVARLPLVFNFYERETDVICELDYNQVIYQAVDIETIIEKFLRLVEQVAVDPAKSLVHYLSLPDEEIDSTRKIDISFNF